ncbi:MAG: hypothetical protein EAX89_01000 [Candidatus Lokiarchaeota archaeon]|nr:hypothetical protein [Candidatus Lokiarchaeota archaeon]
MSNVENNAIQEYLAQVKKKLPEWLKWKQGEVQNILDDLKSQIIEKAKEISGEIEPTSESINEAMIRLGAPETIAKSYKRRGTPKFYITEELSEFYLRTIFFFWLLIFFINIIIAAFQFFFIPWWTVLGNMFSGIWIGCLIAAVVITIAFVWFSMEGFLPEDFGIVPGRLALIFPFHLTEAELEEVREYTRYKLEEFKTQREEKIAEARIKVETRLEEAKLIREQKLSEAAALRKRKLAEAKEKRKQKMAEAKAKRQLKKKEPVSLGELIFGSVAGIIFGLILLIQPFAVLGLMGQGFLDWLKLLGFLIFLGGIFDLVRLAIGVSNYTGQQVMLVVIALYNFAYIPIWLLLLNQPEIFPISLFSGGIIPSIPSDPTSMIYIIYFWVIILIIIGTIGGIIGNFYKVGKISKLKKDFY